MESTTISLLELNNFPTNMLIFLGPGKGCPVPSGTQPNFRLLCIQVFKNFLITGKVIHICTCLWIVEKRGGEGEQESNEEYNSKTLHK